MILICGGLADGVTELVLARLDDLGYDYRLLDLGRYPDGYTVAWDWDGDAPTGVITGPDWRLDLADVSGVYVRYLGAEGHRPLADLSDDLTNAVLAECQSGLGALLEHLPCLVANRATPAMANHSKPYQALAVQAAGLRSPRTLVTSNPAAVRAFYDECAGQIIFKSISGIRSVVRRMEPRDLERLALLRHGPAQFQEFLPGDNIRVHTVGEHLFATRARSESVDYRYARKQGGSVDMEPATLPPEIIAACHRLSAGLVIVGIDLKETPGGDYYCFEANPSPGFAWYEQQTGQPISAALADVLRDGRPTPAAMPLAAPSFGSAERAAVR